MLRVEALAIPWNGSIDRATEPPFSLMIASGVSAARAMLTRKPNAATVANTLMVRTLILLLPPPLSPFFTAGRNWDSAIAIPTARLLPLEKVAEGYCAMDERRAIKTLLRI